MQVVWTKDGSVIDPAADSRYVQLADGTLLLDPVRPEDAGEYVCTASNSAGFRASLPAVLEILCKTCVRLLLLFY